MTLLAEQLASASWRLLGARLQRHQAALAASLTAAIDRGAGLLAEAQDRRQRRTRQLERAADLLQEVTVGLQGQPATPGGQADGRSRPGTTTTELGASLPKEPVGCPGQP